VAELGALLGGRYRLDQVLGQGGMATIFRATDDKLGREVAVKVLRPEFGTDAQFVERFKHEAQSAASLSHPNIVQVYDFGNDPAGPYIVMEQVAGGDLSAVLGERGALPPTAVARTGQQVADALATAHATGLVHRDIKPSNILLSPDGRVQVADFGIAQAAAGSPVTATGITLGSVLYFSPEQARGDTATSASDIYSLGLVMYEMLTGQRAFSGDSPAAVAVARLSGSVPSPMAARAEVPPSLDAIVRWCLATDPAARPAASELSVALARFITDPSGAAAYASAAGVPAVASVSVPPGPPGAPPPPTQTVLVATAAPPPDDPERSGSGPWAWLAAGLGLLVIIASGILLFLLFSGIGEEAPTPSPAPSPTPELVATPDFIDRKEGPATRVAERQGLVLEVEYVETDEYETGRIIEQLPDPGVEIPVGTSVQVTVATQAETVVVPDIHGIKEDKAIEQLEASGLRAGVRFSDTDQLPDGYVVESEPRAGASVTRGQSIDYVVSTGPASAQTSKPPRTPRPTPTPTPTPKPPPSAGPTLEPTVGPGAAPTAEPTAATPAGSATATLSPEPSSRPTVEPSPAPTSTLSPAFTIVPWPSSSPSPGVSPSPFPSQEVVLVGDFLCHELGTARMLLEEAGLLVGATIPEDPPLEDSWIVHDQLPEPGESVPIGSAVDFWLLGPQEPCPAG
jgi:beta-lactam-binding protein with PASTA domain